MNRTLANLVVSAGIVGASVAMPFFLFPLVSPADVLSLISKTWLLISILLTATFALKYKLFDSAYVKGLNKKRQHRLRTIVADKTRRLWLLIFSLITLLLLSAVPNDWFALKLKIWHAHLVVSLFAANILFFCVFVPAMWSELRSFQVAAKAKEDELAAREAYLTAWEKSKDKAE